MTPVGVDDAPEWRTRFRVPAIRSVQVAAAAPERGLVASNAPGTFQLHAWDVPSGRLRTLTNRPTGIIAGLLAPDGRFAYYHDDAGGNDCRATGSRFSMGQGGRATDTTRAWSRIPKVIGLSSPSEEYDSEPE